LKKKQKKTTPSTGGARADLAALLAVTLPYRALLPVAGREGAQLLTLAAASSQPSAGRRALHPPPVTARRWERLKLQQLRRRHSPRALLLLLPLYAITRGMRKGLQEEEEKEERVEESLRPPLKERECGRRKISG